MRHARSHRDRLTLSPLAYTGIRCLILHEQCFGGHGPFVGCIVAPPPNMMPGQLVPPSKITCANCFYWQRDCSEPGNGNGSNFYSQRAAQRNSSSIDTSRGRPSVSKAPWTPDPAFMTKSFNAWKEPSGISDSGTRTAQYGFNGHQSHPTQPFPSPYDWDALHIPSIVPAPQYHPQHMVPQQVYGLPAHQTQTTQLVIQPPQGHPANWQMLPPSPAYSNPSPQTYTHPNAHWQAPHWHAQSQHPVYAQHPQVPVQQYYHSQPPTPTTSRVPGFTPTTGAQSSPPMRPPRAPARAPPQRSGTTPTTTTAINRAPTQSPASSSTQGQSIPPTRAPQSAPPLQQSHSTVPRAQASGGKPTAAKDPARKQRNLDIMEIVQQEEWEKAPGRVQSATSESLDSKSELYYLHGGFHQRGSMRKKKRRPPFPSLKKRHVDADDTDRRHKQTSHSRARTSPQAQGTPGTECESAKRPPSLHAASGPASRTRSSRTRVSGGSSQ